MARYYLILLVAFAVVLSCGAENNIRGGDLVSVEETGVEGVPSDRRRLFSWWSLLFLRKLYERVPYCHRNAKPLM